VGQVRLPEKERGPFGGAGCTPGWDYVKGNKPGKERINDLEAEEEKGQVEDTLDTKY